MTLQTLVSGVELNTATVASDMKLDSDAIVINQTDHFGYDEYKYNEHKICCYSFKERGVGLSRNNALLRADSDLILFSDEDIVYDEGYASRICAAYEQYPDADMILVNIRVAPDRATYCIRKPMRVHLWNCGRYATYSFSCKRESIHKANITFHLLFGGGARYSNGEDSLFIEECLKKGLKIYALPIEIGEEKPRPSTWFTGYNEKYFYDRGVLYKYLYRRMAVPMCMVYVFRKRKWMLTELSFKQALSLMLKGVKEA